MAEFANMAVTTAGSAAIAQAMVGRDITFTRMELGDGELPDGASCALASALVNTKASVTVTHVAAQTETVAEIGAVFANENNADGYWWREAGLFAKIDDGDEFLYAYGNAGELAEWIPPTESTTAVEKHLSFCVYVGSSAHVSVTVGSDAYITREEFEREVSGYVTDITSDQLSEGCVEYDHLSAGCVEALKATVGAYAAQIFDEALGAELDRERPAGGGPNE